MDVAAKPLPSPPNDYIKSENQATKLLAQDQINKQMTSETYSRQQTNTNTRNGEDEDEEFEFFHELEREKVKVSIHFITAELKERGIGVEYLMIPFRPQQTNEKLLKFLNALFPMGNGQPISEKQQVKIIAKTEPLTLFQALKYIWCRLPDGEVIGWKSYLEFKIREQTKDYPKRAFLEIMPQCLTSASHASIVYDFFDLIITMASNSKKNKMSARKISKMCAVWAFGKPVKTSGMLDYDFTDISPYPNNSFRDGLNQWLPGTDAMFHLLLAFLKSFVPQDLESAQLPLTLKSLLFNNDYPPKVSTAYSSETILTIPLVRLKTDQFSRKPWELLERCNEKLDFSNHEAFEAREDYALLKSLFKKKNNVEGISRKMSQESKRLMKLMSTKHSTFQAGWATRKCLPNINHLEEDIEVKRVDIDDYFIWAWLSTLSYEQTAEKKKLFGRSLILEFEFDGFKKWVLFEESDVTLDSKKKQDDKDNQISKDVAETENVSKENANKVRNITPAYEKFQHQVPSPSSSQEEQHYHTVISKDSFGKNKDKHNVKLHSIEQKISKWNPLSKVKKRNASDNSTASESEVQDNKQGKKKSTLLESTIFQLPELDLDTGGFDIEFPDEDLDAMSIRRSTLIASRGNPVDNYSSLSNGSSDYSKDMQSSVKTPVSNEPSVLNDIENSKHIPREMNESKKKDSISESAQSKRRILMIKELPLPKVPGADSNALPSTSDEMSVIETYQVPSTMKQADTDSEQYDSVQEHNVGAKGTDKGHGFKRRPPKEMDRDSVVSESAREIENTNSRISPQKQNLPISVENSHEQNNIVASVPAIEHQDVQFTTMPKVSGEQLSQRPRSYHSPVREQPRQASPAKDYPRQYQYAQPGPQQTGPYPPAQSHSPTRGHVGRSPMKQNNYTGDAMSPARQGYLPHHDMSPVRQNGYDQERNSPVRHNDYGRNSRSPVRQDNYQTDVQSPISNDKYTNESRSPIRQEYVATGVGSPARFNNYVPPTVPNEIQSYGLPQTQQQVIPQVQNVPNQFGSPNSSSPARPVYIDDAQNSSPVNQQYYDAQNRLSMLEQNPSELYVKEENQTGEATNDTIEHLKGMVEEMMFEETNNSQLNTEDELISPDRETFESLTKFDVYRPTHAKESPRSAVEPLHVSKTGPESLQEENFNTNKVIPQVVVEDPRQKVTEVVPQHVPREAYSIPHTEPSRDSSHIQTDPDVQYHDTRGVLPQSGPRHTLQHAQQQVPQYVPQQIPQRVSQHVPQQIPEDSRPEMYQDMRFSPQADLKRQPIQARSPQMPLPQQRYQAPQGSIPLQQQRNYYPLQQPHHTHHTRHPPQHMAPQQLSPQAINHQRMYPRQQVPASQYPRPPRAQQQQPLQQPLQQAMPLPSSANMNFFAPGAPQGNKLHGGVINKNKERKKLYNNIRNGDFGI